MNSRGSVFLVIIGIMGVIFTVATLFMRTTIEEKTQTVRSNRSIQTQCMAEAGLEVAMGFIASKINSPESWKDTTSLAHLTRRPLDQKPGVKLGGMEESLGTDFLLEISSVDDELKISKEALQAYGGPQLDEIFAFTGGDDPGNSYDLEIAVKMHKAVTNLPGPSVDGTNYKVPGVDLEWSCHSEVKEFLNNQGYQSLELRLPDGLLWLSIPISLEFAGVTFFTVDLVEMAKPLFSSGPGQKIFDLLDINKLLTKIFEGTDIYPYTIEFATDFFPALTAKFAGAVAPAAVSESSHIEKIGYFSVKSQATINYPGGRKVTKTVFATKEFKCADVEPVAPMYSFFLSNLDDNWINFNNLGGHFFVNNFAQVKTILGLGTTDDPEKREFPGLVRVNGTQPMYVNLSILGDPSSPGFSAGESFLTKGARGCEWLTMMNVSAELNSNLAPGMNYEFSEENVDAGTARLPTKLQGPVQKVKNDIKTKGEAGASAEGPKDDKVKLVGVMLNTIPVGNLGVYIWQVPLHFLKLPGGMFKSWEMPYCGNSWKQFTLPFPLFSCSVTHFFGSMGFFAPMTREVEGAVCKRYRQWHLSMISYPPTYPPAGKAIPTPWGIPILPIPIPVWHAHDIINKYEYNLFPLKTTDAQAKPNVLRKYDPSLSANSPPNLYSIEQYAKKANFYYEKAEDFIKDLPNRMVKVNNHKCFRLDGVSFIKESIAFPPEQLIPETVYNSGEEGTFYVTGKGMIVCGGNVQLKGNIEDPYTDAEEREKDTPRTVFSLIVRHGGVIAPPSAPQYMRFEGSLYTDKCIALSPNKGLKIVGNWVTNAFSKALTRGDVMVEHVSYKTRSSLNSLHPISGKYDPERYFVSFAPGWETWRVQ